MVAPIVIPTAQAMEAFGASLAQVVEAGDVLALHGDLGAGKTTLARGLIRQALKDSGQIEGDIPSPSFTLTQPYPFPHADDPKREIWHIDLWRLHTPDEIHELGLLDAFTQHISIIEWPARMGGYLPQNSLNITIEPNADDLNRTLTPRTLTLSSGASAFWAARLSAILKNNL